LAGVAGLAAMDGQPRPYSDAGDVLLAPYSRLGRVLHVVEKDGTTHGSGGAWLAHRASSHERCVITSADAHLLCRAPPSAPANSTANSIADLDAVVDDADCGTLEARLAVLWRRLKPGGAYFFPLREPVVPMVQSWIFKLNEMLHVYNRKPILKHYMGRRTVEHAQRSKAAARHPLPPAAALVFCAPSGCGVVKTGPCDCVPCESCSHQGHGNACGARWASQPQLAGCAGGSQRSADTLQLAHDGLTARKVSDKVSISAYQVMYGALLTPLARSRRDSNRTLRLFEIGLGCDQGYGPGASVDMWQRHFRHGPLELWEAEYDAPCVQQARRKGQLDGVLTVTGDQGNETTLQQWLAAVGDGGLDAVIDDGGHRNSQIAATFKWFWPTVRPGGLYFIEDLHVGYTTRYDDTRGTAVISDIVQAWTAQLAGLPAPDGRLRKLPEGAAFVACQTRACVIGRVGRNTHTGHS